MAEDIIQGEQVDNTQQQIPPQETPKKLSVKDFAAKIKEKYPEYNSVADDILVNKMIEKYPVYQDQVDISQKKNAGQPSNDGSKTNSSGIPIVPLQSKSQLEETPDWEENALNPLAAAKKAQVNQKPAPPTKPVPIIKSPKDIGDMKDFYSSIKSDKTYVPKPVDMQEQARLSELHKKDVSAAIDNTAEKALALKGIKAPRNSPAFIEQKKKIQESYDSGNATYQMGKDGVPGLNKTIGFWDSLTKGWNESIHGNKEADDFVNNMNTTQRVEYANRKQEETPPSEYLGELPGSFGSLGQIVGSNAPFMGKAIVGALAGTALTLAAPETAGASLAGLPAVTAFAATATDMVYQGGMQETMRRYQALKKQSPGTDDEELMREAEKGLNVGEIAGGITNMAFMGTGGNNPISQEGKSVVGKFIENTLKSAAHLGGVTAGVEAGKEVFGATQGIKTTVDDVIANSANTFKDNATLGVVLHGITQGITGAVKAPKALMSALKYSIKDENPVTIINILKPNEEAGFIPPGTTDAVMADLSSFNEAANKTTSGLTPEAHASVAGLMQKRNALQAEMAGKDFTQIGSYQEQIDAINNQIQGITKTNEPFAFEVDDVTGKPLNGTISDAPAIKENAVGEHEELLPKQEEEAIKIKENDTENITGLPSEIGVGEKPIEAQPIEGGGAQEIGGGRVLQAQGIEGEGKGVEGKVGEVAEGNVGVGEDVMKSVNDKMRQTSLEMEFKGEDAILSFKNNDIEIGVGQPYGSNKWHVYVSDKADTSTGYLTNEAKSKVFDTKLEALDYAKEQKEQSLKEQSKAELPKQEGVEKAGEKKTFSIDDKEDFYHGSYNKKEGRLRTNTAEQFGDAIYFTTSKEEAEGSYPHVTKVKLNIENPIYAGEGKWNEVEKLALEKENANKERNEDGKIIGEVFDLADIENSNNISDAAKELGYDAIISRGEGNHQNETAILDPSKIIYPEDIAKAELPKQKIQLSKVKDVESTTKALEKEFKENPNNYISIIKTKGTITNEKGNPIVFYHGTGSEFKKFDVKKLGTNTQAESAKEGIFFTDSKDVADTYLTAEKTRTENYNPKPLEKSLKSLSIEEINEIDKNILKHYGKYEENEKGDAIEDILNEIRKDTEHIYQDRKHLLEKLTKHLNEKGIDYSPWGNKGMMVKVILDAKKVKIIDAEDSWADDIDLTEKLKQYKAEGYDAVLVENVYDSIALDENMKALDVEPSTLGIVFNTKNIKRIDSEYLSEEYHNILKVPEQQRTEKQKQLISSVNETLGVSELPKQEKEKVGEVVAEKKAELPKQVKEIVKEEMPKSKEVVKEELPKHNKDNQPEFTTATGRQKVNRVGDEIVITDTKTGEKVSNKTEKKALREYVDNFDFTRGEEAKEENVPVSADPAETAEWIIDNTDSPYELALIYAGEGIETSSLSAKERMIADYGIGKTTLESFARHGDRNNLTKVIKKNYIGGERAAALDVTAKELSDYYGMEIEPSDLIDFMERFPRGVRDAIRESESNVAISAANKFKDLTGLDITQEIAQKAIDQKINKLKQAEKNLLKQDYESAKQLEDEYWNTYKNTDGFTKEAPIVEVEQKVAEPIKEGEPPIPPTVTEKGTIEGGEDALRGITMADNAKRREEIGMPERMPNPETVEEWRAKAQKQIADGYNINNLIDKMEKGEPTTPVENEISRIFAATLDAEVKRNPTDENISKYERLIKAREASSSEIGRSLRSLQGLSNPFENISDFYVAKKEANKVDNLTDAQKVEVQKDFENIQKAKDEYEKKWKEAEAKFSEMQAQNELLKQQKGKGKSYTKEGKRDFAAERQSLKNQLKNEIQKYINNTRKLGISSDGYENFEISVEMAKIIGRIAKSHIEEVGAKLSEVTQRTFEDVKDLFDGITSKDIHDVIAGKYSEKRETKSELISNLRQVQAEAKLLNELDRVLAGEPKTEKQRIERNQKLADLRRQINEVKKSGGLDEYSDESKAKKSIEANKRKEEKIKERLDNEDFDTETKRESIYDSKEFKSKNPKLYKELLDSQVKKHEAELEFHKKLVQNEMANMGNVDKFKQVLIKARGTLKGIFAGIDDSAVGVQNWMQAITSPSIGARALKDHVLDFWSEKRFDRNIEELHNSADWNMIKESGLRVSEPKSLLEAGKEEMFPDRFKAVIKLKGKEYGWINIGGKKYELFDVLKPFERAFTSLGNSLRVIKFRTEAEKMHSKGITFENNPEEFKKLATRINAMTSASEPNKAFKSDLVNLAIWSPRLMTSKLNILGISDLASYTPLVKQGYYRGLGEKGKVLSKQQLYAIADLAKFATSVVAGSYLYATARGGSLNTNPTDDKFMDVELPNGKSYNFSGGYSKYISTLFQLTRGGKVSKTTGEFEKYKAFKDRGSEVMHFLRGKMPPISGSVVNLAVGRDYTGKETSLSNEAERYKMPMAVGQIYNQIQKDGYSSLFNDGLPTFLGINVKDKRDYVETGLFTKEDVAKPELKILLDKGLSIPKLSGIDKYKVKRDDTHPEGVMTEDEYNVFSSKVHDYITNGWEDEEGNSVNGIKGMLETEYNVQTYGETDEEEEPSTEETVLGKDLPSEQLNNKVSDLKEKAIKKAIEDMGLTKKSKIVVKED